MVAVNIGSCEQPLANAAMASALDVAKRLDFQDMSEVLPQAVPHETVLQILSQPNSESFRRCVHPLACLHLPELESTGAPHGMKANAMSSRPTLCLKASARAKQGL